MTCLMEVLQVECVVPHLIDGGASEVPCPNLEFNHEEYVLKHEHGIYAGTQPRDGVLKVDRSARIPPVAQNVL